MGKIKDYIKVIVDNGDKNNMEKLSTMLDELICDLKHENPQKYEDYKICLYEMAYGEVLNEEMAEDWVNSMQPRALWSIDETEQVRKQYNLSSIKPLDFYVLMNMAYSDYGSILGDPNEDLDKYVAFVKNFLNDKDAKPNKLYLYYKNIVTKE